MSKSIYYRFTIITHYTPFLNVCNKWISRLVPNFIVVTMTVVPYTSMLMRFRNISEYTNVFSRILSQANIFRTSLALKILHSPEQVLWTFAVLRPCFNILPVRFIFMATLNWIFMRMKRKVFNAFSFHSVSIFSFRYLVTFQITHRVYKSL